jgi:hypothetical protein
MRPGRASRLAVLGLGLPFTLAGCLLVLSVDPVIPEADAVFDGQLLGSWEDEQDGARVMFSRAEGNRYDVRVLLPSSQVEGRFEARLGRLGGRTVLDMWPTPREDELPEVYQDFLIPGHLILVLEIHSAEVDFLYLWSPFTADDFEAEGMDHVLSGDQLLLRGPTGELREGLARMIGRTDELGDPIVWRRVPEG